VGAKHGYAIMNRKTKKLDYIRKVWEERDGPGKDGRQASPPLFSTGSKYESDRRKQDAFQ